MTTKFNSKRFVAAIKAHIKAHPETLMKEHAVYFDLNRSTFCSWFSGVKTPNERSAQKVAKALRQHRSNKPTIKAILALCP